MSTDLPINGLTQWTFYILGWLLGSLNPLFWVMMYMAYLAYDEKDKFFNPQFHRRVSLFGMAMTTLVILIVIIIELF